jgi:hypothetical protein
VAASGELSKTVAALPALKSVVLVTVCGLLFPSGPTAVVRLVVAVIVNALKRFTDRAFSHVGNEVCKRFGPSIADLYTSAAVSMKVRRLLVSASHLHCHPRFVRCRV